MVSGAVGTAKSAVNGFNGIVATAQLKAQETVSGAVEGAKSKLEGVANGVYQAVVNAKDSVTNAVSSAKSKLEGVVGAVYQAVVNAKDNVSNAVSSAKSKLQGVASSTYQAVIKAKDEVGSAVSSATGQLTSVSAIDPECIITAKDDASGTISFIDALLGNLESGDVVTTIGAMDNASGVINNIQSAINSLPASKMITITVSVIGAALTGGALGFGFATGGIVPHATGSIINRPTLANYKGTTHLFGEAGREAILPLDSYTGWMDEIADKVEERVTVNENGDYVSFEQALANFYMSYVEPVMSQMATDMQRQADKDETTIVKISDRDIRDSYNRQTKRDGYQFTR